MKCDGCGKELKNGRALHAHKLTCRKADSTPPADCCSEPDWKLLSKLAGTDYEYQIEPAKRLGYKEFCDSCGEMR